MLNHQRLQRLPSTGRKIWGSCRGLAARQRGRRGGRHAVRDSSFQRQAPVTWPRTLAQEPINIGDANYDPLYPYGFGLTTK